eukprot:gnl/TRDRNA2_/TRDRNA2_133077_c0_seq1.p1 gnl/TRDRNA2_/TRDRNA2_133077_c0~~gnl/TRDRNA2_/TRDRNA2_133077_c0_seq1.p1  ORF type:complete len:438 (+),score=102.37 gnl/TRDRNA2_/TRDRNA2_133077_c0_seq1:116-1429(+)
MGRATLADMPHAPSSCSACDASDALVRELEVERKERRDEVAFLNQVHSQERALLLRRSESLEQMFADARRLWERERVLLGERLKDAEGREAESAAESARREEAASALSLRRAESRVEARLESECRLHEADAARWSSSAEQLGMRSTALEAELAAARQEFTAAAERAVSAECNIQEGSVLCRAKSAEIQELQTEVQCLKLSKAQVQHDLEAQLENARVAADERVAHAWLECEEQGKVAMSRAVHQLQYLDDCVQSFRQQHEQELTAQTAHQKELSEALRLVAEERSRRERVEAVLGAREEEHLALLRRARDLEDELRAERVGSREVLAGATRERQLALALLEQRSREQYASPEKAAGRAAVVTSPSGGYPEQDQFFSPSASASPARRPAASASDAPPLRPEPWREAVQKTTSLPADDGSVRQQWVPLPPSWRESYPGC